MKQYRVTRYETVVRVFETFVDAKTESEALEMSYSIEEWEHLRDKQLSVDTETEEE